MRRESAEPIDDGLSERAAVTRSVAWNYSGYAYQIAVSFGLTSYIVRRLSVAEYGLLLLITSLSGTLYLLDLGICNILVQTFVEAIGSAEGRVDDLLCTSFLTLTSLGTIGVLAFSGLAATLPGPFNIPHKYLHEASVIFIVASLAAQAGLSSMALEAVYRAFHRFDRINQIQFPISTVQIILSVLVLATGYRIVALALVQLIVSLLRLLLLVALLPASVPGVHLSLTRFSWTIFKPLVHLSKWAFLDNLSTSLFDLFAWMILGSLGSMRDAALFGLASKAPRQLWNLVDKGANVALPLLSKSSAKDDLPNLQRIFLTVQKLVFGAILPFVVLGCFFARPLIQFWAGGQYIGAAVVMRWLLLAALSHAIAYSSDQLLYACGQVKRATTISFCSGAISVASALLLVSHFGAAGLAAGLAIAQLLINCSWFTTAACRQCHISTSTLLRVLFSGLEWPLVFLTVGLVLIWSLSARLSLFWLLVDALITGTVYLALWSLRTALPIGRKGTENVA